MAGRDARPRSARLRDGLIGYLFMSPTVIGFTLFVAYPLAAAVYLALTKWNGVTAPKFVGARNFVYLVATDPTFWQSLKVTGLYVLMTVPTGLALGLFLAVLLNRSLPGIKALRTLYYVPVVVPSVASLALWKFIFNPTYGMANGLLRGVGLPTSGWLESQLMALPSISIISLWGVGATVIVLLSGLQSVPAELYEAARVDGASGWRRFRHITLPLITPVLFLQLVTGMIGGLQQFNAPMILTKVNCSGGGPNFATYLLAFAVYDSAFNNNQFGYAMAQVWILFLITLVLTALIFRFTSAYVYYESEAS
jgi:ABC-type sugar transport system permease subunit